MQSPYMPPRAFMSPRAKRRVCASRIGFFASLRMTEGAQNVRPKFRDFAVALCGVGVAKKPFDKGWYPYHWTHMAKLRT